MKSDTKKVIIKIVISPKYHYLYLKETFPTVNVDFKTKNR